MPDRHVLSRSVGQCLTTPSTCSSARCTVRSTSFPIVCPRILVSQPLRHAWLLSISFLFHACCVDHDEPANRVTCWKSDSSSVTFLDRSLFFAIPKRGSRKSIDSQAICRAYSIFLAWRWTKCSEHVFKRAV